MKKFFSRLIVMALALIMVMSFVGCGESENPNEPDNPDTPSEMVVDITGRTVCGNEPLAGVTISVVDSRGESYPSTVSGSDGKFEIKDVSYRRSVTVTFVKENYFTKNVELSISDLTSGKNAMGDVAISQPEKRMDLTGKIVGLDGVCGIGGVELKVLGFAAEGVSDATGNFVIENAPIGSEKLVIEAKKDKYATRQVEVDVSDIKDGNIGNIELFIRYESVNGSPGIDFTVTRGETSFKVIYNFTKNIYGPQNIQIQFLVGDSVDGVVYNFMNFGVKDNGILAGRDSAVFKRKVSDLSDMPYFPEVPDLAYSYSYSQENKQLVLEVPYESIGVKKGDTVGYASLNAVFNAAANDWVRFYFSEGIPEGGTSNIFTEQMFFDFDDSLSFTAKDNSFAQISGTITDSKGDPLEGVTITADNSNDENFGPVETDAGGKYTIAINKLYPATVYASKTGYVFTQKEVSLTDLRDSASNVDLQLNDVVMEKTLTGRVKNLTGVNESGVEVGVFGTDISVKTDKDGIYTIPDAPIGKDGVMLTFSKFPYKDIMKTYDLDTVEASGALGDVDMFAEFGGSQRMQFAIARQEAGIRFVFRTETLFGTNEIMWPYIMYANETKVYFYALQAPGSGVESAWGVTSLHPLFPGDIGGAWGAAIIGHDTYDFKIVDGVTYIDWFIPYTDLPGLTATDTFGVCIVGEFAEGKSDFGNNMLNNGILPTLSANYFINFTADGNFELRA